MNAEKSEVAMSKKQSSKKRKKPAARKKSPSRVQSRVQSKAKAKAKGRAQSKAKGKPQSKAKGQAQSKVQRRAQRKAPIKAPIKVKTRPRARAGVQVTERDQFIGSSDPTQSGDTQGLSGVADADSESVKELVEEGQYFEAEVVDGIENAPTSDAGEIRTREVPEDDVPAEYRAPSRERQS
jgi:hypothetical protein